MREVVSMKEIELELAVMGIYEDLMEYVSIYSTEMLDYAIEDEHIQFFMLEDGGSTDEVITVMITSLFTYDLNENDGDFSDSFDEYFSMRILSELLEELDRISREYKNYED